MTDTNIVGPFGPGIDEASGFGADTWFKPCVGNVPETGTKIPAIWLNKVAAFFRHAIRGLGVAQVEIDDDMLLKCFQTVDKRVDNNDSVTGVGVFQGMDVTGLIHLLRKVIGVNGIAVQISSDGKRIEVDGSGLGGVTFPGNWKYPCRVATTANVADLAAAAPNIVDSKTLVANDRVLVRAQTTPAQNGIYTVTVAGSGSNGTWVRATDFDSSGDAIPGSAVVVTEGTLYADSMWELATDGPITLNTTGLSWLMFFPVVHNVFGPSGTGHAQGHVPDPGAVAGTAKFLCEDGNWRVPQINVSPDVGSIVVGRKMSGTTSNLNSTFVPSVPTPLKVFEGEDDFTDITVGTWRCCGGVGVVNWGNVTGFVVVHAWQRIA